MKTPGKIENQLQRHFPILFSLLDNNSIDWRTVEKVFTKKFVEYQLRRAARHSTFRIEASFYNIITSAGKGSLEAIRLLDYIQNLFLELNETLSKNEKTLIKENIYGFLTNMDMKYLNFLGELSVLNLLKRQFQLELIGTEVLLNATSKTKIDFKFRNIHTQNEELFEVVNIQIAEKGVDSEAKIENLLTQKIGGKLLKKGMLEGKLVYLYPVIWGQWDEIKFIIDYYGTKKPSFQNTSIPLCFIPFIDLDGKLIHRFGAIDEILK